LLDGSNALRCIKIRGEDNEDGCRYRYGCNAFDEMWERKFQIFEDLSERI
ncbi:hypothetical protein PanWU01x14_089060, partial [Parasponia andersonii]